MSVFERLRSRQLDLNLAALQLLAFLATVILVMDAALLYRHFTVDALTPTWAYLMSLKLAFPPVLVLGVTYLYAFLTGETVANAPKSIWRHVRNSVLQSDRQLAVFLLITATSTLVILTFLHYHTPPEYNKLVQQLLGGANDDHQIIKETVDRLKDKAPELSARLSVISRVFEERRLWNNENKSPSTYLPRIFIRQLSPEGHDTAWATHPLRLFAIAEANSMLAQALVSSVPTISEEIRKEVKAGQSTAVASYEAAISDQSGLSTDLLKKSALQNIGNVYYYSRDWTNALIRYSQLPDDYVNAGTEANRIAALVSSGKTADAHQIGDQSIHRLQGRPEVLNAMRDYVGLLTNTGFAKLILGKYPEAIDNLQAAYSLIPDSMAKQNLALALIGARKLQDAIAVLDSDFDAPPVSPDNQLQVIVRGGSGSCTYLIRALALAISGDDLSTIHANVLAYAKRPQPSDVIVRRNGEWKEAMKTALQSDARPCGDLRYLPLVAEVLK